jgi:hypothetical protein
MHGVILTSRCHIELVSLYLLRLRPYYISNYFIIPQQSQYILFGTYIWKGPIRLHTVTTTHLPMLYTVEAYLFHLYC